MAEDDAQDQVLDERARAQVTLEDIEREEGRNAERIDVERLLKVAGFQHTQYGNVRTYYHEAGVTVSVHQDSQHIPVGTASWIAAQVRRLGFPQEGG